MFIDILKGILRGKSLLRTLMNLELRNHTLRGRVLDVGGGVNPSYFEFFQKAPGVEITNIDLKNHSIDFEKDSLPYADDNFDRLLVLNLLEHIYNYKFLLSEVKRTLKQRGEVIGFVPFLINYHPDPRDYFRYTKEALEKIFAEAGFKDVEIKEVGLGPFAVAFNAIFALPFPKVLKALKFPLFYLPDKIALRFRPRLKERYPLGYLFILKK